MTSSSRHQVTVDVPQAEASEEELKPKQRFTLAFLLLCHIKHPTGHSD